MFSILSEMEGAGLFRTTGDGVTCLSGYKAGSKRTEYRDGARSSAARDQLDTEAWGVVTRHRYAFQRTVTVIAAREEVALKAMVHFLTNEDAMAGLAKALKCRADFPAHFQALFRIDLFRGHSHPHAMSVEAAVEIGNKRTNASPK